MTRLLAASLALALLAGSPAAAESDQEAESFIRSLAEKILRLREDKAGEAREKVLMELLVKNISLSRVSRFILGPYARDMDKETRKAYKELLPEFVSKVYVRRLLTYEGEVSLEVTKSVRKGRRGREAIVYSMATVENFDEPIQIQWWLLRDREGSYKLFDINLNGFWAAQWQRAEFVSQLRKSNGDFAQLMATMRAQIGGAAAPSPPGVSAPPPAAPAAPAAPSAAQP